jgi:transposase
MLIFAIDLGQSKSVFCTLDTETGEYHFGGFSTRPERVRKLLRQHNPQLVVVEVCPLAAMVHDLAAELGLRTIVADPTQDAWQWKNVKRKTDQDDALKLARLAALNQLNAVYMPSLTMRQWRRLVETREALVAEQTRCKNRIRALLLTVDRRLAPGKKGWAQKSLTQIRELTRPLADCSPDELWRGILLLELDRLEVIAAQLQAYHAKLEAWEKTDRRVQLVASMPGIGTVTAAALVAILDNPHRFRSRRQVAAYGGLTPRRYQSGQMDRQGRISKRGNATLRHLLNQAAWAAVRYSPWFRAFFLRVGGRSKARRKQAIVALMHKILVTAWAIMRDERPYHASALPTAAAA